MAKKRRKKSQGDFKPDPQGAGLLSRLYVTPTQRLKALKWGLYALTALLLLVIQDVILNRISLLGGTTDLVPTVLLAVCILQGPEAGGAFTLIMGVVYVLSGSSPGAGALLLLTVIGIGCAIFRESFLRRSFSSVMLCAGAALILYELAVFTMGLFLGRTIFSRVGVFLLTALLSALCCAALYPVLLAIDRIGGETWKE